MTTSLNRGKPDQALGSRQHPGSAKHLAPHSVHEFSPRSITTSDFHNVSYEISHTVDWKGFGVTSSELQEDEADLYTGLFFTVEGTPLQAATAAPVAGTDADYLYPVNFFFDFLLTRLFFYAAGQLICDLPNTRFVPFMRMLMESREVALGADQLEGRNVDSLALKFQPSDERKALFKSNWLYHYNANYLFWFLFNRKDSLPNSVVRGQNRIQLTTNQLDQLFLWDNVANAAAGNADRTGPNGPVDLPVTGMYMEWDVEGFTNEAHSQLVSGLHNNTHRFPSTSTKGREVLTLDFRQHQEFLLNGDQSTFYLDLKDFKGICNFLLVVVQPSDEDVAAPNLSNPGVGSPWNNREWEAMDSALPDFASVEVFNQPLVAQRAVSKLIHHDFPRKFPLSIHGYKILCLGQIKRPKSLMQGHRSGHINLAAFTNARIVLEVRGRTLNQKIDAACPDRTFNRATTGAKVRFTVFPVMDQVIKYHPPTGKDSTFTMESIQGNMNLLQSTKGL